MTTKTAWTSKPPPKRALRRPRWYWVRVGGDDPYPTQFTLAADGSTEYLSTYGWVSWREGEPFLRSVAPIEEPPR